MTTVAASPSCVRARWTSLGEWAVVLGLAATLAGTTLALGGFLASTLVVASLAVLGLGAFGGVVWWAVQVDEPRPLNRAAWWPVPFLLYALGSVLWIAPARWLAWREWLLWLQMWLVFVLVLHLGRSRRQTWVLVGTLVGLGLVGAGMAAHQRFVDPGWLMLGRTQAAQFAGRSSGMFGIPNSLAGLLELMVPSCLALAFARRTKVATKVACGWLAAVFVFALVLTGSRGGWIGLGLALVGWPLLDGRDWRRRLAGVLVVVLLAGGGLWALYRFSENARVRLQPFLAGEFESSRPIIWRVGWTIWRDHPWLGSGAASYNVLFDQHRPRGFLNEPFWTHNDYLNTLSDYGALGFGLWFGAGFALAWLGWRSVQRARREARPGDGLLGYWRWRLGLWIGLAAFALHLTVDFHTKIPALAFAAAVAAGLLLREEPGQVETVRRRWVGPGGGLLAVALVALAVGLAWPLYRAEALREEARRSIDRLARGDRADQVAVATAAGATLARALAYWPDHGQAWADAAYAAALSWHRGVDLPALGRDSAAKAERAVRLCPVEAEFWVRQGVALDMQARHGEAEACFKRAVALAPTTARWWFNLAYHFSPLPGRQAEARAAVETCLSLDPANSAGVALRQQLAARD